MDYLWAPWRMPYILSDHDAPGCIFCEKPGEDRDFENGILYRGATCFVMMNAYPYNPGHLMVIPYRHAGSLTELPDEDLGELMVVTKRSVAVLNDMMAPSGMNMGINQGRIAGAGIVDHVHQHIVPRWSGDTNFMTTVGQTRVLPEMVEEAYRQLAPGFNPESFKG
jgi:ATP adenylyltransferase